MQFMDVMAPLAALHNIRHSMAVQRRLTPSIKLVLNLPTPKGWKDESSSRVPRPGVEPGPLMSEGSVLPLDPLLSHIIFCIIFCFVCIALRTMYAALNYL